MAGAAKYNTNAKAKVAEWRFDAAYKAGLNVMPPMQAALVSATPRGTFNEWYRKVMFNESDPRLPGHKLARRYVDGLQDAYCQAAPAAIEQTPIQVMRLINRLMLLREPKRDALITTADALAEAQQDKDTATAALGIGDGQLAAGYQTQSARALAISAEVDEAEYQKTHGRNSD